MHWVTWHLDLIGRWKLALWGISPERPNEGSLGNFFMAASNKCWCEGSVDTAAAVQGQIFKKRGLGFVGQWASISCIVKLETRVIRAVEGWVETRTTYLCPGLGFQGLLGHTLFCILINPPQIVWKGEETWQSGRTHWEAVVGVIKKKKWFGLRRSQSAEKKKKKTGDLCRQVEPKNWLFVAVWGMNMCVCLCLPPRLWRQERLASYPCGKTNKASMSIGSASCFEMQCSCRGRRL